MPNYRPPTEPAPVLSGMSFSLEQEFSLRFLVFDDTGGVTAPLGHASGRAEVSVCIGLLRPL